MILICDVGPKGFEEAESDKDTKITPEKLWDGLLLKSFTFWKPTNLKITAPIFTIVNFSTLNTRPMPRVKNPAAN